MHCCARALVTMTTAALTTPSVTRHSAAEASVDDDNDDISILHRFCRCIFKQLKVYVYINASLPSQTITSISH